MKQAVETVEFITSPIKDTGVPISHAHGTEYGTNTEFTSTTQLQSTTDAIPEQSTNSGQKPTSAVHV